MLWFNNSPCIPLLRKLQIWGREMFVQIFGEWNYWNLQHTQKANTKFQISKYIKIQKIKSIFLVFVVTPCGACRPWIFFINGVLCFFKFNGSGMEKEEI